MADWLFRLVVATAVVIVLTVAGFHVFSPWVSSAFALLAAIAVGAVLRFRDEEGSIRWRSALLEVSFAAVWFLIVIWFLH